MAAFRFHEMEIIGERVIRSHDFEAGTLDEAFDQALRLARSFSEDHKHCASERPFVIWPEGRKGHRIWKYSKLGLNVRRFPNYETKN